MISLVVAFLVLAAVATVVVVYARDPGPTPVDIALGYELAWDRLDFDTLWTLSSSELRDGLNRHEFVAAKAKAYEGKADLRHLVEHVDVDEVTVSGFHALVRTRVALRDGAVVHNDVSLTKRASAWAVNGYQLVASPPKSG